MCRNCFRSEDGKRTTFLPDPNEPVVQFVPLELGAEYQELDRLMDFYNGLIYRGIGIAAHPFRKDRP